MSLLRRNDIRSRLALTLWGATLLAFIVAGIGLALYQSLTLEQRARQIMAPYAELLAVGTDAAVAFEDPVRTREILETLRVNPQILEASIYLSDGRLLAKFSRTPNIQREPTGIAEQEGLHLNDNTAELVEIWPGGARLSIRMELEQLSAQTHQALWIFGTAVLVLLTITLVQFAVLRRTIVQPITSLTKTVEGIRVDADFECRIPSSDTDELSSLGNSINNMLRAIGDREGELRRLTDFQRAIIDNAAYGIVSTNPDGTVTSFNPAAQKLLGYAPEEVIGKATPMLWHDPAEVEQRATSLSAQLDETIAAGFEVFVTRPRRNLPEEGEWTFIRKDGQRVQSFLSITALRNANGSATGFVGLAYDLTERKQAEAALQRLNRELRALSNCNEVLVRAKDEQSLLDEICRIVCDEAGYRMAWVGYLDVEAKALRPAARAGVDADYIEEAIDIWTDTERGTAPPEIALRSGEIAGFDDFANEPDAAPWREAALRRGFRSSIALPLKNDLDFPFGVLVIYATEANAFTPEERRLLGELADDLAFGIVTLRARAEHAKAEEQIQIAATAFEAQEGIIITDVDQVILRVNQAFTGITGYSAEEVVGRTPRLLSSEHHDASFFRSMWNHINAEGSWQGEIWNRRKSGEIYPEWLNISAVRNAQGQVTHYVGTMVDITERKEAEKQIEHLAFYDLLTGLPNRRLFVDRLQQAMAGSARSRRMSALLFIDLDNFKIVNDTCGHDVGDRLLAEVALRLSACVRDGDTISRLGGDEFIAMLEDLSESPREAAAQARSVAGKIIDALNQPYSIAGRVHHSTPSVGATIFVGNENSVDDLLKQADIAMYQAKSAGRNTLRFFDPEMQAAVAVRAALEADLRVAIEQRQFVIHYQPQVNCRRIVGAEALLRWQHPERGMISPAQFIPLAEETGQILPLGQWVLEEACALLAAWARAPGTSDLQLAVNVSARQFRQANFVDSVCAALVAVGAPATQLKLELTESVVLDDVEDTVTKMRALKELGVGFSMDDFGTGYSSLSYLTQLPLDQLKIDRSFVRNLPDSQTDAVVTQAIIMLANSLGLEAIAEGVETEAQRSFLEQHGCPAYQGYLSGKPVPLVEFEQLLERPVS